MPPRTYSLTALTIQPDAIVYAFEPTPEIAGRLEGFTP